MPKAMLENSIEEEKIKILFAKIIQDKTKDELLNTFKNVEWKTICNRKEREKNLAGLFMERVKDKFLAKKHQDKKMAPEKKVFLEFSNQSTGDDLVGFYNVIKEQYNSQTKENLKSKLKWLKGDNNLQEKCCYYCGISEQILTILYNVKEFRTKRNRGEWFEIDRKETKDNKNIYSSNNMVLSCYYCNNHKSDVISAQEMRGYFGESMYNYLSHKVKRINI